MPLITVVAAVALLLVVSWVALWWHGTRVQRLEQWALAERRAINRRTASSKRQADDRLLWALNELDRVDDDTRRAIDSALQQRRY